MLRLWVLGLSPLAYFYQAPAIEVAAISVTPTQAVLAFSVADPAGCKVEIARDAGFSSPANDTNPSLFPGSQDCGRSSSIVEGSKVTFVAGFRAAQKAADGRFYSRALQAYTTYYYRVTSGSATATGSFTTANVPVGKTFGEPFPFDRQAPGHYAWPSIDWSDAGKEYIDPLTGVLVKRMTGPGQALTAISDPAPAQAAYEVQAGSWSTPFQGATIDGKAATFSGTSRAPLFLRAPQICPGKYNCERVGQWDQPYRGVDDIEVTLQAWCTTTKCSANTSGERNVDLCLTVDGVSCATDWKTVTAGTGSKAGPAVYPSRFPAPLLAGWVGGSFSSPIARPEMATLSGTVDVDGSRVIYKSGQTFNAGAWTAGSRITIGGVEYTIASVDGATELTLNSSAGSQSGVPYTAANFGVLVRKSTPSTDQLQVDGASFRWAESDEFEMGPSGTQDLCSPVKVTDSKGQAGFLCNIRTAEGFPTLWFIAPQTGEARFLGEVRVPFNFDTRGGDIDGNYTDCTRGLVFDGNDPTRLFCVVDSNASPSQGLLVFRGTYNPGGVRNCNQPGDFQAIPSGESCLITWEYLTKPSQNATVLKRAQRFDSRFNPARFPYLGLFSAQGNHLGFSAWAGQDTAAWTIWLDTATLEVVSMQDYYSKLPCRFCAVHSTLPLGDDNYNAVVVKDFVGGNGTNAGPYQAAVTAVAGANDGSLRKQNMQACPADIPQQFKDAGAAGENCALVTVSGDPCDPDPSAWELANQPACAWHSGWTTLQPIIEGDEANDGGERFLFVKKISANEWFVLRNYNIPHGSGLNEGSSTLADHASGWKLTMACAAGTGNGYVWVNFPKDAHGDSLLRDNALSRAEHGDITTLGTVIVGYAGDVDRFGFFLWNTPIPGRIGKAADIRNFTMRTFGGIDVTGSPVFRDFIQTHPSWRQVGAPPQERLWFLDGNPFAPQSGGQYTLWQQDAKVVSGSLYKLGPLPSPLQRKYLPTVSWSGRKLLEDVSGPGSRISGDSADNWKYCVADFAGECVPDSAAGDVYVNAPSMTLDGLCGNTFFHNRPCFTSMVNPGIGINQLGTGLPSADHARDRHLTSQLQRYNATWTYDNAIALPDGSWAITSGSWLGGVRNDLLLIKLPPFPPPDSLVRSDFVDQRVPVHPGSEAPRFRARFGYAENGGPDPYCTSRKDACTTGGTPFAWLSEKQELENCSPGSLIRTPRPGQAGPMSRTVEGSPGACAVHIPAISGRVLYYFVDYFDKDGKMVVSEPGVAAVP